MISFGVTALGDLFLASASVHHARPALWADDEVLTYDELRGAAARISRAILAASKALRGGRGRQCALLVDRSQAAYASVLGALLAGFAYVPLNRRFPPERLRGILNASDADLLIVDAASIDVAEAIVAHSPRPLSILLPDLPSPPSWIEQGGVHDVICRGEIERMATVCDAAAQVSGDDGAYLLFTSGSTGLPKGVLIRHRNALAYICNALQRYRPTPQDRFTQLFDFSFDLSVHDMFVCWSAGACLYCPPADRLTGLRTFVREHELTFWFSVPSTAAYMSRMHMLAPGVFPTLRMSLFCGEAMPSGLSRSWQRAAPHSAIENLYGPTEATIAITAHRVPDEESVAAEERPIVPIGLPFPNQYVAVIDENGRVVPDGQPGELCLAGSQVASGYWRLPEITAERFSAPLGLPDGAPRHWYRTGDRVMKSPDCGLVFLGRVDHQAKVRGHRVDLHEVEAVVRAASGRESVAALPWPVDDETALTRQIVVFVAGHPAAPDDIVAMCRRKLPPPVVPRQVLFIPDWPLNVNGKTDYSALKQRLRDQQC